MRHFTSGALIGLAIGVIIMVTAIVVTWSQSAENPAALSNPSPSGIIEPTTFEQVRVSAHGVRLIPCTERDYYENEPAPALCFYAENGHVSPAHPPTVTATPGGQQ